MTSIADQLQQMLLQRAQQSPSISTNYGSALSAAAQQDEQSINDLRTLYSDPSKVEHSKLGAFGLGLMAPTRNGRFSEGMFNGLAAATEAQNYNQQQNFSREEKLAKLGALEAQLTRQKAQDQLGVYDTQGKVIQNMQGDNNTLSDLQLQNQRLGSRPLQPGEQGPVAQDQDPLNQSMLIYNDYLASPQKYAGPQGQAMVKRAVDLIQSERMNQRYIDAANIRRGNTTGERVMPNSPEGRRISARIRGYDEAADAAREITQNTALLKQARSKIDYEGTPGADWRSWATQWFTDSGAAGRDVKAKSTNFKLELSTKLKGAISDKEQAMLDAASPGLDMADATADNVMAGYEAGAQRAIERSKFMKEWYRVNGNDYGADEAWDQYISDNPIVQQDKDGNLIINKQNVGNWQDYLQHGDGSAQPSAAVLTPDAFPDNKVLGTDASGQPITWADVKTTAEENGMTVQEVIDRLTGKGGN